MNNFKIIITKQTVVEIQTYFVIERIIIKRNTIFIHSFLRS